MDQIGSNQKISAVKPLNPILHFGVDGGRLHQGHQILMEDDRIICLYTLCLSSNTARPLDGVGVPQKAYNSFIFQQNFEALGVIFHPPPQNEKLSSSVKLFESFDLIQIGQLCDEYWP